MCEATNSTIELPVSSRDVLTELLRQGAQEMLATAIETEVAEWIAEREHLRDEHGHRQVVRNGRLPKRQITTGVGPIEVAQPRVRDNRPAAAREKFTSKLLPPYLRKTRSIEELLPWLYLKGISTGDFNEALQSLLGGACPGLSASTITRLIQQWQEEYQDWSKRSLADKRYVYVWADGVYFNIRLEEDRPCILVLMGATEDGQKELLAIVDGYRESEQSWTELLLDVKARGLTVDPKLATGDGALGFWKALPKAFPKTKAQRCWFHKSGNVIDKLPKRLQAGAKRSCTTSGWLTPASTPRKPSTCSSKPTRPSIPRRLSASTKIERSCWPSTTSRPSTGFTCGRPTRSRVCSRRSSIARRRPAATAVVWLASRWSSS